MTTLPVLKMSVFFVGMTAVLISSVAASLWRRASEVSIDFGPGERQEYTQFSKRRVSAHSWAESAAVRCTARSAMWKLIWGPR